MLNKVNKFQIQPGVIDETHLSPTASIPEAKLNIDWNTRLSEVSDARTSDVTGTHASLDARLEAAESRYEAVKTEVETARGGSPNLDTRLDGIETNVIDLDTRVDALETEVTTARNGYASLDARLDAIVSAGVAHTHYAEDKQIGAGDPLIGTSTYTIQSPEKFVAGDKSLQVFLNGMLQMVGVHYNEVESGGAGTGGDQITFIGYQFVEGDILQLRWHK